jgi:phospholipid/cholesterol/gamma-HCH transport system substrate-binding protein
MQKFNVEAAVGIFLIAGFLSFAYIAIKMGDIGFIGGDNYPIQAVFTNVSGLKPGAQVEMAGVAVGKVDEIKINPDTYQAVVKMMVKKGIKIQDDSIASVKTAGIIGDKYIKISPGASDVILEQNSVIRDTESALDLEELVSKYIFEKK